MPCAAALVKACITYISDSLAISEHMHTCLPLHFPCIHLNATQMQVLCIHTTCWLHKLLMQTKCKCCCRNADSVCIFCPRYSYMAGSGRHAPTSCGCSSCSASFGIWLSLAFQISGNIHWATCPSMQQSLQSVLRLKQWFNCSGFHTTLQDGSLPRGNPQHSTGATALLSRHPKSISCQGLRCMLQITVWFPCICFRSNFFHITRKLRDLSTLACKPF